MNFVSVLQKKLASFAILKIAVNPKNEELVNLYKKHVDKHNESILSDPFPNSGFDLFFPEETRIPNTVEKCSMVSMDVKCEMLDQHGRNTAYYMFPRSSFSKTPLMLGNHTGIIDSGYRGNLIGAFRNLDLSKEFFTVEKHNRLLQVCHPSLYPIHVVMVDESELSSTARGTGGFGSTGL